MYKLNKNSLFTVMLSLCISFVGFAQVTQKEKNQKTKQSKDGKDSFSLMDKETGTMNSILLGHGRNDRNDPLFENIANSKLHVIVSEGIAASDLKVELNNVNSKKYTIFAPRDKSFNEFPEGRLAALTAKGNEDELDDLIKNHVVEGEYTLAKIQSLMAGGKGKAELKTLSGLKILILKRGNRYALVDEQGNKSYILAKDYLSRNGVVHDISDVLQKK